MVEPVEIEYPRKEIATRKMAAIPRISITSVTSEPSVIEMQSFSQSADESKYSKVIAKQKNYVALYLLSAAAMALTWQTFHDIGLSTLLTLSVFVQCVALGALCLSIAQRQSASGISLKCLYMQTLSFGLRLCSTVWLKGYIPVDSTGDWLYQFLDVTALLLCALLCFLIGHKYQDTYDEKNDTFPAGYTMLACTLLSTFIHPDLNNRPVFDAIWTCSLYTDVFSMLPQIFLMMVPANKRNGRTEVDALTAHYVFLIGLSRVIDLVFWCYGYEELAPEKGGFNLAGWTVLLSHVAHVLLMLDFGFLYVRALWRQRANNSTVLDLGDIDSIVHMV